MMPEPHMQDLRRHPLFPLMYRNMLRLVRRMPDNVSLGEGIWSQRMRTFMTHQIIRRAGIDGDDLEGTHGYAAACEGHNASVARDRQHYAELCAYDTLEQIQRMGTRDPIAGSDPALEDADLDEIGLPGFGRDAVERAERPYPPPRGEKPGAKSGLAAMTVWSRNRR